MWRRLQQWLGGTQASTSAGAGTSPRPMVPPDPEPEEIQVPEVGAEEVLARLNQPNPPLLVDVREPYEWRQVRIPPGDDMPVVHIPMNDMPQRLAELPGDRPLVIVCAHGSRSYSVAAWLLEQERAATSLAGGIHAWLRAGGPIEQG